MRFRNIATHLSYAFQRECQFTLISHTETVLATSFKRDSYRQ